MTEILKSWEPRILSVLRIMAALLFVEHGTMKLLAFPAAMPGMSDGLPPLLLVAGIMELAGGAVLAVGLFTRPVAFLLSGEMAIGYFLFHAPHGFYPALNMGEPAVLYCFVFLYLVFAGGGAWGVDAMLARNKA